MSKIICDVCGTSYPDTAPQCPICGYVNSGNHQSVSGDTNTPEVSREYTYVRGGRFSKKNVKKRNQAKPVPVGGQTKSSHDKKTPKQDNLIQPAIHNTTADKVRKDGNGKKPVGLIITAVVLLLAIVAMVIYISLRFFASEKPEPAPSDPVVHQESSDPSETEAPDTKPSVILCQSLKLDTDTVTLDKVGASRMLYVSPMPEDTTELITYKSLNPEIATVTGNGKITAVAPGEAVIVVSCGNKTVQCKVSCTMEDPTEETTEEPTEEETKPDSGLKLNRKDITFARQGDSWTLYSGNIAKSKITWKSADDKVAKFEGGTVTAVGRGTTTVTAEYNGEKVSCIIRCVFKSSDTGIEGNGGGIGEDDGGSEQAPTEAPAASGDLKFHNQYGAMPGNDCTISIGESVDLYLKDSNGNTANNVTWSVTGENFKISGNRVTAVSTGNPCVVTALYNGVEYKCKVFVR